MAQVDNSARLAIQGLAADPELAGDHCPEGFVKLLRRGRRPKEASGTRQEDVRYGHEAGGPHHGESFLALESAFGQKIRSLASRQSGTYGQGHST